MGAEQEKSTVNNRLRGDNNFSPILAFYHLLKFILLFTFAGLLLWITGCKQSFQPIQKSDKYPFSIYGYLDASADTQWVRVTPPRRQAVMSPEKPVMTVTLRELNTGRQVVMHDSLFQLRSGVRALNVWTTMDIKPKHTYRLTAGNAKGNTSSVTVSLPEDFPDPNIIYREGGCMARVEIKNVQRLADFQWVWRYRIRNNLPLDQERIFRFPYRDEAYEDEPGAYEVLLNAIDHQSDVILPAGEVVTKSKKVFVASAGPEWVGNEYVSTLTEEEYTLPDVLSDVNNGVGYLVGIVSKTVPYEKCD